MSSSKISKTQADAMLAASRDPAYREMNRAEAALAERLAGNTPDERFSQLIVWLGFMTKLQPDFQPDRSIQRTEINLL